MTFECQMFGEMKYGKWARGVFKLGDFCKVKSIYEIKSASPLEPKNIYKVKNIEIIQKRNGSLGIILEI